MKHTILLEIIRALRSRPTQHRKLKFIVGLGLVGAVAVGALALWAGASAVNYAVTVANQVALSPTAQEQVQNVKSEFRKIQFQPLNCWQKAQTLLTVQSWLERPALDNLRNLKVACLDSTPATCEGGACDRVKELSNVAEGTTI